MLKRKSTALECVVCRHDYHVVYREPFVGKCGHTICESCMRNNGKPCPICKMATAFSSHNKNFQLIDVMREMMETEVSKRAKCPTNCRDCGTAVDEDDAYFCLSCTGFDKALKPEAFLEEVVSKRYCKDCQEDHEDHNILKLSEVQRIVATLNLANEMKDEDKLCIEMKMAWDSVNIAYGALQKKFPIGGRLQDFVKNEKWEETFAKAKECHEKVKKELMQGIAGLYKVAHEMEKASNQLFLEPWELTNYKDTDSAIKRNLDFHQQQVNDGAPDRPMEPTTALQFYLHKTYKIPLSEIPDASTETWGRQIMRSNTWQNSHFVDEEHKERERYTKEMAEYFNR